jgi:hypothetical protein
VLSNIFYTFAARILVMKEMNKCLTMVAAAMMAATSLQAQTERSEDFKAKYELKEVVVMSWGDGRI